MWGGVKGDRIEWVMLLSQNSKQEDNRQPGITCPYVHGRTAPHAMVGAYASLPVASPPRAGGECLIELLGEKCLPQVVVDVVLSHLRHPATPDTPPAPHPREHHCVVHVSDTVENSVCLDNRLLLKL